LLVLVHATSTAVILLFSNMPFIEGQQGLSISHLLLLSGADLRPLTSSIKFFSKSSQSH
jgi:hypothetical protein